VLKAFGRAAKINDKLRLIFVGPDSGVVDSEGNTKHFTDFCKSILPPEVRARVEYRGRMANEEIMSLRTQSMATIIASRWENQGYALLEAMFQGCPVVSADSGGCPESVVDGVTGLLAKSEDPVSFSDKLLQLIGDPASAEMMGRSARQHVLKEHAANRVARLSLEVYARLIQARSFDA
jgi:glycosyltransferase involved in cell wall biosynthesis